MKQLSLIFMAIVFVSCSFQMNEKGTVSNEGKSEMPSVNENGVGQLKVGSSLSDCIMSEECDWIPSLDRIKHGVSEKKFGFYNRTEMREGLFTDISLYLYLYDNDELMAALDCNAYGDFRSADVSRIIVYSPKLKMMNGIHTGMSAKKLVNDFGADIAYEEGAETEILSFKIATVPDNIKLVATAKTIKRDKIEAADMDTDFILQLDDVEDCKLSAIVINQAMY